jgi:hypothetical protein
MPMFDSLGAAISSNVSPVLDNLGKTILPALSGALGDIQSFLAPITEKFNEWAAAVKGFQLPKEIKPGSPTPMELGLRGVGDALISLPKLGDALGPMPAASSMSALATGGAGAVSNSNSTTFGNISISINGGSGNPQDIGKEVDRRIRELFRQAQSGRR